VKNALSALSCLLVFLGLPMLIVALAPYWAVAVFGAVYFALWWFATLAASADPDPDPYEGEGMIRPDHVVAVALVMTLAIRIISAYLQ
jgi:hypothetical protein